MSVEHKRVGTGRVPHPDLVRAATRGHVDRALAVALYPQDVHPAVSGRLADVVRDAYIAGYADGFTAGQGDFLADRITGDGPPAPPLPVRLDLDRDPRATP
jgi:hypothetical protein